MNRTQQIRDFHHSIKEVAKLLEKERSSKGLEER